MEDINNIMENIEQAVVDNEQEIVEMVSDHDFGKVVATGGVLVLAVYGGYHAVRGLAKAGRKAYGYIKSEIQKRKGGPIETAFVDEEPDEGNK